MILLILSFLSTQVRKAMTKGMCMCMVRPCPTESLEFNPTPVGSPLKGASLSHVEVISINFLLACQASIHF